MEKLTKGVVNCTTGEQEIVEIVGDELLEFKALQEQAQANRIAKEAEEARIATLKASAKAKLVAGEPLTEEEASVLVI